MRSVYFSLLTAILLLAALPVAAQTCNGSFGDPVIHEDFGSGSGLGQPLPASVTNYAYAAKDCPDDGWYTIANVVNNCFGNSWYNIRDAKNVPNGYFMLVNANNTPGIFYTQKATVGQLCANTVYEFAAMITNVMRTSACGNGGIRPNLTFSIETTDGTVLKTYDTGSLDPDGIWRKYGTTFTTPNIPTDIFVKIINNAPGGCGNDLALDEITFRACGPDVNTTDGTASTSGNHEVCAGDNETYTITAAVPPEYRHFQWQQFVNNAWEDMPGENSDKLNIQTGSFAAGTYPFRVAVVHDANVGSLTCRIFSSPSNLIVNPIPDVTPPTDRTVCYDGGVALTASGGSRYIWSGPGLTPTETNTLALNHLTLANSGLYSVYTISTAGCQSPAKQFNITVLPAIVTSVTPNSAICRGESINLQASGGTTYQWLPAEGLDHADIANPVATPAQTTTYTVRIGNGTCFLEEQVTVTVVEPPAVTVPENKGIFEGQSVKIEAVITGDNIDDISWSPATYLDDPSSPTPTATPPDDITYTVTVRSLTCGTVTSLPVFVRVYKKIVVPNTFTPNGDGVNDLWNIEALFTYPQSVTTVYNRNGQMVYRSVGYSKPWNGTYNNAALPAGTYYYIIDLKNSMPKMSGYVTILR